ncbi:kinetochore-associated protein DSN1 homolog [Erythrolamprus reginae]|uniref:kinetochore-associated protein DSN1 homolog n=1 Tax=Erythrolamprus reginae TaxID=121349 RepID=UPI00396CBA4F
MRPSTPGLKKKNHQTPPVFENLAEDSQAVNAHVPWRACLILFRRRRRKELRSWRKRSSVRADTDGILPKVLAQQISSQDMESASVCGENAEALENECAQGLEKASSQGVDPEIHCASTSFNESFGQLPSPKVARRSMSRFSMKLGGKPRRSLPPFHFDILDLSKAISLHLPEADRMAALLLSSFQYSARKLEQSLGHMEGFNFETFQQNVSSLSEELMLHTEKLILDGFVQKCFDDPKCALSDPAFNEVTALKDAIARFSAENQAWDELLLSYQKKMEEISRQLESCELKQAPEESCSYLGTSQAHVLQAKPDYQKILDCQGEVFYCLQGVLDEISQMVKVCQTYVEDTTLYLQKLSTQLASRTFLRLEKSPARKLLKLFQTNTSVPPPPKD